MKTYLTKVTSYGFGEDSESILGIEVPEGFIRDLDLKYNEVLKWSIDPDTKTATITKENIILNN